MLALLVVPYASGASLDDVARVAWKWEQKQKRTWFIEAQLLPEQPLAKVEYVEIRDADSLEELERTERRAVIAVAVDFEGTRLIDNAVLEAS